MKLSINLLFTWLFCMLLFTSCQVQKVHTEESLLWQVSGKGINKPTYIFGTHHLMKGELLSGNEIINKKLQQTDLVAGEIIIDADKATEAAVKGMLKDNTLDKILSDEDFKAIDKVLKEQTGYSLLMLNMFKPMTIYMLISNAKQLKSLDKDAPVNQLSMDEFFQHQAKQMGKEVIGLESMEDQLNVLYNVYPLERQVELLKEVVYDKDQTIYEEMLQVNRLYKLQQTEQLYKVVKKNMLANEYQALLVDRNNKWIDQLVQQMPKQSMFVAVGAMHLAGPEGLIYQLKKRGYKVQPIKFSLGQ